MRLEELLRMGKAETSDQDLRKQFYRMLTDHIQLFIDNDDNIRKMVEQLAGDSSPSEQKHMKATLFEFYEAGYMLGMKSAHQAFVIVADDKPFDEALAEFLKETKE